MKTSPACVFSLLCGVLAAPAAAQATWVETPTAAAPSPRMHHAAAFDFVRGRLVVFGGMGIGIVALNDTWELSGATWTDVTPTQSPPARTGHWMASDVGRARVVLFGGTTNALDSGALGDTWEWDGTNWTQRHPAQSPSARFAHAMTTDWLNPSVVLFGGRDMSGTLQNDTWAWDGTNWTLLATTGPSPRGWFDLVQDVARARIVLFGGSGQGTLGDTWEFDGLAWQEVQPAASPLARHGHRMSYDIGRNQLILNGGNMGPRETWQWSGVSWTLIDTGSPHRLSHVMHHDWQTGRATMFGGTANFGPGVDTTWTFGVASPATFTSFGSPCSGPAGTPLLYMQGTSLPSIGRTITLRAAPVSAFSLFLFGWSNVVSGSIALPYSLAPHGAPGCSVLVSPGAVFGAVAGPGSAATMAVALPFAPAFVGVQFFNQAVSFDPGANPLGLTTSNGLRSTIGWQ